MAINLCIGADIVPTASNMKEFISGDVQKIIDERIDSVLQEADYCIFNLETPITDVANPIDKAGSNFIIPTSTMKGINKLHCNMFTLSNNHIMDQGSNGLIDTMRVLTDNGIDFVGAGEDIYAAQVAKIVEIDGLKIGIYACAEHEFSIATDSMPGANPFDPLNSLDHIEQLKQKCDFLIVLYHGMKEFYRYPTPYVQKVARRIIDKGADLMICQHTHCVGCEEDYKNGKIVYGQGNFLFDGGDDEYWNNSLLLNISIDNTGFKIDYIPIQKKKGKIYFADSMFGQTILDDYRFRSEQIKDPSFINEKYNEIANDEFLERMIIVTGWGNRSFWFKVFDKLFFHHQYYINHYKKEQLLSLQNYLECEVHHEMLVRGIQNRIKEIEK